MKLSGDGAPFSHSSSYILLSFSLTSLQKSLSSSEVHTVAVLKGVENYETLQEGLAPVLAEMKEVMEAGFVEGGADGTPVELEFYLGGDYKVVDYTRINLSIILIYLLF